MNSQSPSFTRIISTDYPASVVAIMPLVLWGMYYFFPGPEGQAHDPLLAYAALGLTFLCGLALVWRWRSIASVFLNGEQVDGTIASVNFQRERVRVAYTYAYLGGTHERTDVLLKNKRTSLLYPRQEVTVVLSREKPERAYLMDLYL